MNIFEKTKYRSAQLEIMDDFSLEGDDLKKTLGQIASINKWLGGNAVVLKGLKKMVARHPKDKILTILDLGCGNGDMLRKVAEYLSKNNFTYRLIGIDANKNTIVHAEELSRDYPHIVFFQKNILDDNWDDFGYDLAIATLFYHHFSEEQIVKSVNHQIKNATLGVLINDLHRHWLAYGLFKLIVAWIQNPMIKQDGLTSIRRGFKRIDLVNISKKIPGQHEIRWKWAFRYQWIIRK